MNPGKIVYAQHNSMYIIKMIGTIKYTLSSDFDVFIEKIFHSKNFSSIVIDMSETEYIDSTNLGLLAKIANYMFEHFHQKVTIISTNDDVCAILHSVGFTKIFSIIEKPLSCAVKMNDLEPTQAGSEYLGKVLLEAHEFLAGIDAHNNEVFKNVIDVLKKNQTGV